VSGGEDPGEGHRRQCEGGRGKQGLRSKQRGGNRCGCGPSIRERELGANADPNAADHKGCPSQDADHSGGARTAGERAHSGAGARESHCREHRDSRDGGADECDAPEVEVPAVSHFLVVARQRHELIRVERAQFGVETLGELRRGRAHRRVRVEGGVNQIGEALRQVRSQLAKRGDGLSDAASRRGRCRSGDRVRARVALVHGEGERVHV
jgi:hypothetical protein